MSSSTPGTGCSASAADGLAPAIDHSPGSSSTVLLPGGDTRLGILINPLSGGNRSGMETVRKDLESHPRVLHREVRTPSEVMSVLTDFARREINVVAISGGDGTVQAALTALFHRKPFQKFPLLALLRSGTDSMIAKDVGLTGGPKQALRRLLAWAHTGNGNAIIRRRSVLRVRIGDHQEPFYGMFLGAACIYQAIQFCRSTMHTLGMHGGLANGLTLLRFLFAKTLRNSDGVASVPIDVGLDENPMQRREYLLMLISTLERLSMGLRPYWGTESGPLRYTALRAHPEHLLGALPSLARGRKNRFGIPEYGYFSHNVREVRLNFNSGFTVDGELFNHDDRNGPVVVQDGGQASFLQL